MVEVQPAKVTKASMELGRRDFANGWLLLAVIVLTSAVQQTTGADCFVSSGFMNSARDLHTATLLPDGKVLVAGGTGNSFSSGATNISEIYNPRTGTWTETGAMNLARWLHTATPVVMPRGPQTKLQS